MIRTECIVSASAEQNFNVGLNTTYSIPMTGMRLVPPEYSVFIERKSFIPTYD